MVNKALGVLFALTTVAAVQIGYAPPAATSFVYRNDHNSPASFIQVGAHGYKQPFAFAAPLPIAQPLKLEAIEAYDLEPKTLPYIAAKPIIVEEADDDDDDSYESEEYADGGAEGGIGHGLAFEKGAGSEYGEGHHAAYGEKGSKGYHNKGLQAKGESGSYGKQHDEGYYSEADGQKKGHHDEAGAHGKHHSSGESYKGGDHGHKKHFSKGEDITGYHKVFNKDEFKKDHDFYDVADNSGHFKKHGYENKHHGGKKGGHKEGGTYDSAVNKGGFGKEGFLSKGHIDAAHKGSSAEEGHDSHYKQEGDYGKKGGSGYKKEYAFGDDGDDGDNDHDDDHE